MSVIEEIRARLAALEPVSVDIGDDSHLHAGHAGARSGGHYRVTVVSDHFAGKTKVARQRMIYDALGDLMRTSVHALAIDGALTAEEANSQPTRKEL
ncbi:BolA family transcriptional regulator [Azoarcus sp. KH32C]|uniref:BolA family protein n=1 Tax=Azoarcus sp. KH32C TaxID=748247 RepID=UPI0002385EFA|nr:BolA family protein [Azoarcus sp. KH32C]BAL25046.1 BolA family protein/stress-induced morphogen [Azoarcus sp. KH32C]